MPKIDDLFPDGTWASEDEYVIRCPYCGDSSSHAHLYINVRKRVYNCYRCGEAGKLRQFLREFADGASIEEVTHQPELRVVTPTDFFSFLTISMDTSNSRGWEALQYLQERGLTTQEIQLYGIRYAEGGRYDGRVIIPIYEGARVVCFSARSYKGADPKYLYPHRGETPLTTAEAVYGLNWAHEYRNVVLVEGAFDAMGINRKLGNDFCGLALLSKHMSPGQLNKILHMDYVTRFYVMMDADAHEECLMIAKRLFEFGRAVSVCLLEKGDPASESPEELSKAVQSSEDYYPLLELEMELQPDVLKDSHNETI